MTYWGQKSHAPMVYSFVAELYSKEVEAEGYVESDPIFALNCGLAILSGLVDNWHEMGRTGYYEGEMDGFTEDIRALALKAIELTKDKALLEHAADVIEKVYETFSANSIELDAFDETIVNKLRGEEEDKENDAAN